MKSITFITGEFKQEKTSAWLVTFVKYVQKLDFVSLLEKVKVKMKKVDYSVQDKLLTIAISIAAGCKYTSDINEKLVPDTVIAELIDIPRFPDQSQINELLRRMTKENVEQLKNVHHQLFMQNTTCLSTTEKIVVDIDQSGLIANGKTYEVAQRGYFCKNKNQKGYQLSAAFCGDDNRETISLYLDAGNTHCSNRFDDLLNDTLSKLKDVAKENRLILRLDSGYGSNENIEKLKDRVKFVVKGYSTTRASNIAKTIAKEEYEEIDRFVDTYELPSEGDLRFIIVRTLTRKGDFIYTMLISNINKAEMSAHELFHFYNQRQTIEAFFKTCKNVYHMKNLRTRKFDGIYAFLWIVFITHNIISWMKRTIFHETKMENVGIGILINKLGMLVAEVRRTAETMEIVLPEISALGRRFVECIQQKSKSVWQT